jgi:putative nucleotidyltransferase with HDIG domain
MKLCKRMITHIPDRQEAMQLLKEFNKTESLIKHGLSVEAVMRHFAKKYGKDQEKWGIIGLIHDLDWEMYPEQHCKKTEEILHEKGWPEDYIRAIISHAWGMCTDVEPQHVMENVLYATDELTGLVTTSALVRPSRSVMDMEADSVKKKWTNKKFAAGVNREVIENGARRLNIELTDLISETILAMREVADEIGLK